MATIRSPLIEYGLARCSLPGQRESGDVHLVRCTRNGVLIAAVDGLGHGEQAACAANAALSILASEMDLPIISLVNVCHEKLRSTRGVVMSLAQIEPEQGMMTWLGIGNVQGVLQRANCEKGPARELLLLRGGVVGAQLPPLQATVLPVSQGDTLYFATDGIRSEFSESLTGLENPQRAADRIRAQFHTGIDDALVLVARLMGIGS